MAKGALALLLGGFGIGAWLRRRKHSEPMLDAPADALRAKLAEARAEPPAPEPAAPEEPDARRRDVHERARRSLDELA